MIDRKHRDFSDDSIIKLSETFSAFQAGTLESEKSFCADATLIEDNDNDDCESFDEKMTRLAG